MRAAIILLTDCKSEGYRFESYLGGRPPLSSSSGRALKTKSASSFMAGSSNGRITDSLPVHFGSNPNSAPNKNAPKFYTICTQILLIDRGEENE